MSANSLVHGFFRFWYDFLIGDDWKIAAGVVVVLVIGAFAVSNEGATEYVPVAVGLALVGAFAVPLVRLRSKPRP